MNEMIGRHVKYKKWNKDRTVYEERDGKFLSFAEDCQVVVIETNYGEILRLPYSDVEFKVARDY